MTLLVLCRLVSLLLPSLWNLLFVVCRSYLQQRDPTRTLTENSSQLNVWLCRKNQSPQNPSGTVNEEAKEKETTRERYSDCVCKVWTKDQCSKKSLHKNLSFVHTCFPGLFSKLIIACSCCRTANQSKTNKEKKKSIIATSISCVNGPHNCPHNSTHNWSVCATSAKLILRENGIDFLRSLFCSLEWRCTCKHV